MISIGNLCVGGTGKTPMAIYLAQTIKKAGYQVCVVSRGYRGSAENKGGIVSDGRTVFMSPAESGDEPFMMAKSLPGIPILVGKNRYKSGVTAVNRFNAEVIVLDDGFQHRRLHRDTDLILLDYKAPFDNGRLLPAGRLREPVSGLSRCTAVIFTRSEAVLKNPERWLHASKYVPDNKPVFYSTHEPVIRRIIPSFSDHKDTIEETGTPGIKGLCGKRVVAFSGIADNNRFKETLASLSVRLVEFQGFTDHHPYSIEELTGIAEKAIQAGADYLATTEKDYVRLPHDFIWPVDLLVIGINLSMGEDENTFSKFLLERLRNK